LIAATAATPGVGKVALTTNGWNLHRHAAAWRSAGLTHLNVSVDSLDTETFARITGRDRLPEVLAGIDGALANGYAAVKLNAVLLRESVEAGFASWTDFVRDRPVAVRFIELMRTGDNAEFFAAHHVRGTALRDWLTANGWTVRPRAFDDGPALEFEHPDHAGRIGLIAPYAAGFCDSCNRLRVTARGKLRLCLFGEGGVNLRDLLGRDHDRAELVDRITSAMSGKALGHRLHENRPGDTRHLAQLGG
jgi:cyclic pyranopterin phosphate synthase